MLATLGFSALVFALYVLVSIGVPILFAVQRKFDTPEARLDDIVRDMASNGFVASVTLVVASGIGIGLVFLFCRLRRGIGFADYLALKAFRLKTLLVWMASVVAFLTVYYFLAMIIHFQDVAALYMPLYETAEYVSLFLLARVVISPLFEEVFFRGFVYKGIAASRLGVVGAIFVSSLFWAGTHFQYDALQMSIIFAFGLLLGLARAISGSLYLTMTLHSLYNLIAFAWVLLADHFHAAAD